jgi:hypothetical protein
MEIRTANTAVGDLDVDVVFLPLLGLKWTPFHLAVDGIGGVAEPALELVIGRHFGEKLVS